jgi:hypothetical protein
MTLEGMGHDLPRAIWPRLIDAIAELACQADDPDEELGPAAVGAQT